MEKLSPGGWLWRGIAFARQIAALRIGLYAANACYFLVLSVFPGLGLLMGLLRYTPLEPPELAGFLEGFLPEPFIEAVEALIRLSWQSSSAPVLGITAVTTLWSASRGIYGLLTGLNAVWGVEERRGWLRRRLVCMGYTVAFLLLLAVTLVLLVFGTGLVALLQRMDAPILQFVTDVVDLRFALLLLLQTGVFCAVYLALPSRPGRFLQVLPGAILASCGWLVFSRGYAVYAEHFAPGAGIYGPVYGVALALLWLYCCMAIVLFGGAWNAHLLRRRKHT